MLVAVVIASAIVGGGMLAGGGGGYSPSELTVEEHQSVDIASPPAEEGSIDVSAATSGKVVVIDAAHQNNVDEIQLRPLVNALTENGHSVRFYRPDRGPSGEALNKALQDADAFVSVAPDNRFSTGEAKSVEDFLDAGGRVLAAGEPETGGLGGGSIFSISVSRGGATSAEFAPALSPHGLTVGSGYLYDTTDNVNNHANLRVSPAGESDLTAGVEEVVVHEATPVTGENVLLRTDSSTELSTTRDASDYGVLAQSGNLAVLGDSSVLDPDWAYVADNEVLVGNLVDYLVTGERTPMPEPSGSDSGPGPAPRR
ncbi:hypothetical protein SAMN04487945_0862 [Halobacterium jilantaiense]|uniref:GATase domain protein n=1 Tax=Halobacterium jilantaiense TaxID=355548 RepID=A0A1I0NIA6_9EURY|nr:hypothetical protein SAMN04487945_0862 [Halobacterium jilantaiense]